MGERNAGNMGTGRRVMVRGMLLNILWNVLQHSREYPQTFQGMLPNISGNILKYLREDCQIFREMPWNIPESVLRHSGECLFYSKGWRHDFSPRFYGICSTEHCMEFAAVGWKTVKQMKLDQAIRNLTFEDLEIPLVVNELQITGLRNRFNGLDRVEIPLVVNGLWITGLRKTGVLYLLDFLGGKRRSGDFVCVERLGLMLS